MEIKEIKKELENNWNFSYGKHLIGAEIINFFPHIARCHYSEDFSKEKSRIINYLIKHNYIKRLSNNYFKNIKYNKEDIERMSKHEVQ